MFKITLLGTGCPAVSTSRYGAATLVQMAGQNLLIDTGSGVCQRLLAAGLTGADIDGLLITHMHSDHLVDLYQFIIASWHQSRDRPQKVYGPPGIKKFIADNMDLWRGERDLRIKFEQRTSTAAFDIDVVEFDSETQIVPGVRPVRVKHSPVEPAFGFVFEADGKKAVVSGDTRYCENLIAAAYQADLLVHEVFDHTPMAVTGTRTAKGLEAVRSYHTVSSEVGQVASKAQAKTLVLTHIVPPDADREQLVSDVSATYAGPVIVGEDLMSFDLVTSIARHGNVVWRL